MELTGGINTGKQHSQWVELHQQLIERNELDIHQALSVLFTSDSWLRWGWYFIRLPLRLPTIIAMLSPQQSYPQTSIALISQEDTRWSRCDADIKSTALLGNILFALNPQSNNKPMKQLLHRNGIITEAASANVFMVIDGAIHTPKLKHELLPGITRKIILDLAQQLGVKTVTRNIALSDLDKAQEVWISSSTRTLMPCHRVDHHTYEAPGPIGSAIQEAYQRHIDDHCLEKIQ